MPRPEAERKRLEVAGKILDLLNNEFDTVNEDEALIESIAVLDLVFRSKCNVNELEGYSIVAHIGS